MSRSGQGESSDSAAASLLIKTGTGDQAAFSGLYDLTAPRVLGFIARFVPDRDEAEDLMVTTYLDLWRFAPGFDPDRDNPALVWMLRRARARVQQHLRHG